MTATPPGEALKPCPFCGKGANYRSYADQAWTVECASFNYCYGGQGDHVFNHKRDARSAWNTRAAPEKVTDGEAVAAQAIRAVTAEMRRFMPNACGDWADRIDAAVGDILLYQPPVVTAYRRIAEGHRLSCPSLDGGDDICDCGFDGAARVLAAVRASATPSAPTPANLGDALAWFSTQHALELSHKHPVYGDDDDQDEEWQVHRQSGPVNDREWDLVGKGETVSAAILDAYREGKSA